METPGRIISVAPQSGLEPLTYRLEGGCYYPSELLGHMAMGERFERSGRIRADTVDFKSTPL